MKTEHKIGLFALGYSIIAFIAVWIIVNVDTATWVLLGSAASMFSYGQLLTSSKSLNKGIMSFNILVRFGVILAVLVFAYFKTDKDYVTLIFVLIGLIASKVGLLFYYLFFSKKEIKESEVDAS